MVITELRNPTEALLWRHTVTTQVCHVQAHPKFAGHFSKPSGQSRCDCIYDSLRLVALPIRDRIVQLRLNEARPAEVNAALREPRFPECDDKWRYHLATLGGSEMTFRC